MSDAFFGGWYVCHGCTTVNQGLPSWKGESIPMDWKETLVLVVEEVPYIQSKPICKKCQPKAIKAIEAAVNLYIGMMDEKST